MFKFLKRRRIKHKLQLEDLYAASVFINPLLSKINFALPFTQYAARPFVISILFNEIVLNNRKNYLELGGGLSTILLAKAIDLNGLETKITCIDHDKNWLDILSKQLGAEGLLKHVELVYAGLNETNSEMGIVNWYDSDSVKSSLKDKKFDLIFVDGPPGYRGFNRYPAFPFLSKEGMLQDSYSFYLDDAGRKQEIEIVKSWEKEFEIEFDNILNHLSCYRKGESLKVKLSDNK